MEPNRVNKPYMIEPVVHHNTDGPNSNESSFHSSQDEYDYSVPSGKPHEAKVSKDIEVGNR